MGQTPAKEPDAWRASKTIMVGCIDYTDQIRSIWSGMADYFQKNGVDFDFVLFTNYDRQVEALMGGFIDIAWNGPLAHVRTQRRTEGASLSLGMRDVDCDFVTHILVRKQAGIASLADLKDKRLAVGTRDSPQACILPMQYLKSQNVPLETISATFYDRDLGKHGDTALGEIEVMNALAAGFADAGFVSDLMWQRALSSGDVNNAKGEELEILAGCKVPLFNHCQFDALPTLDPTKKADFERVLFKMDYSVPEDRRIMQLEGIRKTWERAKHEGYQTMHAALADVWTSDDSSGCLGRHDASSTAFTTLSAALLLNVVWSALVVFRAAS